MGWSLIQCWGSRLIEIPFLMSIVKPAPTLKYPKHRSWQWLHLVSGHGGSPLWCSACIERRCASQSKSGPGGDQTGTAGLLCTLSHCSFHSDNLLPPSSPVQSSSHPKGIRHVKIRNKQRERSFEHQFDTYLCVKKKKKEQKKKTSIYSTNECFVQ